MKTYVRTLILGCLTLATLWSCTKDEIDPFSGETNIYFEWAHYGRVLDATLPSKLDSTDITFAYELPSVSDSLLYVPVKIQGYPVSEDREVKVAVMESTTAVAGVDYSIPDRIIIPADSVKGYIPLTINRTEQMKTDILSLKLELQENENFKTDIYTTEIADNVDRPLSYTQFEVTISDILTEPLRWVTLSGWLGDFSAKKLYLLAEVNGIPVPNYNVVPNIVEFFGHVAVLKAYLAEQKAAGTPVLNDDGTEMTMGPYA